MARRIWTTMLVAGACLGLAACTGGAGGDQSPGPDASSASAAATSAAPKSTPLPAPPDFGDSKAGVAADVQITECPLAVGDVVAKGTALNSAAEPRDIAVIVIWLKNDSGSPLGSGMVVLPQVPAGETVQWEAAGVTVDMPERCVLNATAGQPQG